MAGERKGKAYEAVVLVALEELRAAGAFRNKIFWQKTPLGMSIKPDLTIGTDENTLSHYLLITNSGSAKESEKKMGNSGFIVARQPPPRAACDNFGDARP